MKLEIDINLRKYSIELQSLEKVLIISAVFERIPDSIKCLPTKSFKRQLTRYLLHKCFYSLNQFYTDTDISSSSNHYDKLQNNE